MELTECSKTREKLIGEYNSLDSESRKILESSYSVVSDTKACESRLTEIKEFCKNMGYSTIGVAFCKGLKDFGLKVDEELSKEFNVYSVCCNICKINKPDINVRNIKEGTEETACNPLGQAQALKDKDVDFILKCGFCLGHDILFSKNINCPSTMLVVKDRKLKHKSIDTFSE